MIVPVGFAIKQFTCMRGRFAWKKPEDILKDNPGSVIFARYADELAKKGDIKKAIHVLEEGIRANPSYAFGHSVLPKFCLNKNHLKKLLPNGGLHYVSILNYRELYLIMVNISYGEKINRKPENI